VERKMDFKRKILFPKDKIKIQLNYWNPSKERLKYAIKTKMVSRRASIPSVNDLNFIRS